MNSFTAASEGWTLADWDNYWTRTRPSREVVSAQRRWVRRVIRLARNMKVRFDSIADFGCGPALALFELARRFPQTRYYGFDASPAVIRKNTERARNLRIPNIAFNNTQLPDVPKKTAFSLVLCIATLHYTKDSLLTIQNLYSTLKPGGFLIFNYPNLYTRYWYRRNADRDMRRRFAIVIAGENILSRVMIEAALSRPCHNFWTEVGETGARGNPCILVKKL